MGAPAATARGAALLFSLIAVSVRSVAHQADPLMLNVCIQAGLAAAAFAYTATFRRRLRGGEASTVSIGACGGS